MPDDEPDAAMFDDFAEIYDLANLDRAREIAFYCHLAGEGARSLLDLGCGTGTITIPVGERLIAQHGPTARIVGIDQSHRMLQVARRRAPDIEWMQGDLRAPPVNEKFDLIICGFNVLQFLVNDTDILKCCCYIRDTLTPSGTFAFDIYNPNLEFLNGSHSDREIRSLVDGQGRRFALRERGDYDPSSRVLVTDWYLLAKDSPADAPTACLHAPMRQYFPEEVERLLAATGLTPRERYGDFDRSPFTALSKHQVLVCGRSC